MKKLIIPTILIALFATTYTANAQRWEGHDDRRNDNRHEDRRYYRDNDRRGDYEHYDNRNNDRNRYYHEDRRNYYHEEPRVISRGYGCEPHRVTYYYYPGANVYFNPFNHLYTFPFRGSWVNAEVLPNGYCVNEPYREVYCNEGEDICAYNTVHINYFRPAIIRPRFSIGIRF